MLKNLKRKECYQGCFAKWQKQRETYSWDAFVTVAPSMAKQCTEIPNSLRDLLKITAKKWNGSKFKKEDGLHSIPDPLALAIESMLVDAMCTGQEIGLNFVMKVIKYMTALWNEHIGEIREHVLKVLREQEASGDQFQPCNGAVPCNGRRESSTSQADSSEDILDVLQNINLSATLEAQRHLDVDLFLFHVLSI